MRIWRQKRREIKCIITKNKIKKGKDEGTIAIIGPKRMEYDRVVGMLEYMKENIER